MSVPLYSLRITAVGNMLSTLCGSCGLFYSPMPFPTILRVIALYTRPAN
ncbi:Uncharacterised protein [Klebsiella pneumoniae]|uniref:Uncharacterized protein n=1 Tax=Klebsiella pneumoniae TaxID=573 RepID=A0A2X3EHI0_KLEPN|nr:Uncharacterised protein [Klebsiella pneumoniae]VTM54478.1 Uncharacterised protein [Klebsiella pneumoniae]